MMGASLVFEKKLFQISKENYETKKDERTNNRQNGFPVRVLNRLIEKTGEDGRAHYNHIRRSATSLFRHASGL
jgi:hypothetical protein